MRRASAILLAACFWAYSLAAQYMPGPGNVGSHSAGGGPVVHVKSTAGYCNVSAFAGNMGAACPADPSTTFTYTASATGDAVLFYISCGATSAPTAALTGTGWTFTQVGSVGGTSATGFGALFRAYAPNTTQVTITDTWSSSCSSFMNVLAEEFSGTDPTNFVDNSAFSNGSSGTCSYSITPASGNAGLVAFCNDDVTGVGTTGACASSACTVGGNDTQGDWSEWKILSGQSGVAQTVPFTGSGGAWEGAAVTIKVHP